MKLARLKEWRESHGLTQKELAAAARASEWTVARAEAGEEVRPNTARRLAEVMEVTVADLLEEPPIPLGEEDPQHWERVLASVRGRQREVEAKVEELVALPDPSKADLYQVKWALDEARDCQDALLLALPGSHRRHSRGRDEIVINPVAVDVDQWQKWLNAKRFYDNIVERLVEAGLVELRERIGQRAEPVPVGIGA
jgi:transcriptional regulator with XRE-family HTH domain